MKNAKIIINLHIFCDFQTKIINTIKSPHKDPKSPHKDPKSPHKDLEAIGNCKKKKKLIFNQNNCKIVFSTKIQK